MCAVNGAPLQPLGKQETTRIGKAKGSARLMLGFAFVYFSFESVETESREGPH